MRVRLYADEMYPMLTLDAEYLPDTEVPNELINAVNHAWAGLDAAQDALLNWLHEREPDHPIFHDFPRSLNGEQGGRDGGS